MLWVFFRKLVDVLLDNLMVPVDKNNSRRVNFVGRLKHGESPGAVFAYLVGADNPIIRQPAGDLLFGCRLPRRVGSPIRNLPLGIPDSVICGRAPVAWAAVADDGACPEIEPAWCARRRLDR